MPLRLSVSPRVQSPPWPFTGTDEPADAAGQAAKAAFRQAEAFGLSLDRAAALPSEAGSLACRKAPLVGPATKETENPMTTATMNYLDFSAILLKTRLLKTRLIGLRKQMKKAGMEDPEFIDGLDYDPVTAEEAERHPGSRRIRSRPDRRASQRLHQSGGTGRLPRDRRAHRPWPEGRMGSVAPRRGILPRFTLVRLTPPAAVPSGTSRRRSLGFFAQRRKKVQSRLMRLIPPHIPIPLYRCRKVA